MQENKSVPGYFQWPCPTPWNIECGRTVAVTHTLLLHLHHHVFVEDVSVSVVWPQKLWTVSCTLQLAPIHLQHSTTVVITCRLNNALSSVRSQVSQHWCQWRRRGQNLDLHPYKTTKDTVWVSWVMVTIVVVVTYIYSKSRWRRPTWCIIEKYNISATERCVNSNFGLYDNYKHNEMQ